MKPDRTTLDLIETLTRIEDRATRSRKLFEKGAGVVNGRGALRTIEEEARDALDRAKEATHV